jgi:hypothetical protein
MQWTTFKEAIDYARECLLYSTIPVRTESWQGISTEGRPDMATHEVINHSLTVRVPTENLDLIALDIMPNKVWADEHFAERVSGHPLNPPPSWERWPWAKSAAKFRACEKFNHTYPERIWPKWAMRDEQAETPHAGIRYYYGDLGDVVRLLQEQPHTRQAFLPIWFPEDTGVVHRDRAPCTIGYHFLMRDNKLHLFYPIRSCDYMRHFRDDIYLAVRLQLWVIDSLRLADDRWLEVSPGDLSMHIYSLHCFRNDWILMRKAAGLPIAPS